MKNRRNDRFNKNRLNLLTVPRVLKPFIDLAIWLDINFRTSKSEFGFFFLPKQLELIIAIFVTFVYPRACYDFKVSNKGEFLIASSYL